MKSYLDCIPCIIRQSVDSVRWVTDDQSIHEQVLRDVLQSAGQIDLRQPPPAMGQFIHARIRELTGIADPYCEAKRQQNQTAEELAVQFKSRVVDAPNPLDMAVRLAIAGNIIDIAVKTGLEASEIRSSINASWEEPLDGGVTEFSRAVNSAARILYLTDNAGEIVFDRFLIQQLPRDRITVAVRGAPVINDATLVDAQSAGITDLVPVIDNGSDAPGTILDDCSELFREHFATADLIIAKGQGNFETLRESPRPVYFLLRVKCPVIARDLGCPVGRMVLRPAGSLAE